jgi:hypothetical protein
MRPIRGDHVRVRRFFRLFFLFQYWHHGIYIGHNLVIEFGDGLYDKPNAVVRMTTLDAFQGDRNFEIVEYEHCCDADIVIERARSLLGEGGYNVILWNCEHVATWCKTGIAESRQVKTVAAGTVRVAAVTGGTVGVARVAAATAARVAAPAVAATSFNLPAVATGLSTFALPAPAIAALSSFKLPVVVSGLSTLGLPAVALAPATLGLSLGLLALSALAVAFSSRDR